MAGLLVWVTACSVTPPAPVAPEAPTRDPAAMLAAGDPAGAAREWQRQALSATPAAAARLRIRAAEAWLMADRADLAEDNLRWIEGAALSLEDRVRADLCRVEIAIRAGRGDAAWGLLQQVEPELPESLRPRWAELRSQAARLLDQPAMPDYSTAIALSDSIRSYQPEPALELLQALETISSGELARRASDPAGSATLNGWLDLALLIRRNLADSATLGHDLQQWKVRHPAHFVTPGDAADLWQRYRAEFGPPPRVAILLPRAGRLQPVADALRDGILSAYLDRPGGAELLFLNSGEEADSTPPAYFEARDQGADWIIGPVQKESVGALLDLAALMTPVLALNDLPEGYLPPAGLHGEVFGMSLSQEAEIEATAKAAYAAGLRRAIVLAPETEWGERMAQGFSAAFLQHNGVIVASTRYPEEENDHSALLERLLRIDESIARKDALENVLQLTLEFEPVRREDIDMIFLAANPRQGRLITPQLKFHNAGDLPVFATGRIYSGRLEPARDQDLNGVRLPLTPLEMRLGSGSGAPALASAREGTLLSLQALGRDAWNVLPWLDLMRRDPDLRFAGVSGTYRVTGTGNLQREPGFAIFRNGAPVPWKVEPAPVPLPPALPAAPAADES